MRMVASKEKTSTATDPSTKNTTALQRICVRAQHYQRSWRIELPQVSIINNFPYPIWPENVCMCIFFIICFLHISICNIIMFSYHCYWIGKFKMLASNYYSFLYSSTYYDPHCIKIFQWVGLETSLLLSVHSNQLWGIQSWFQQQISLFSGTSCIDKDCKRGGAHRGFTCVAEILELTNGIVQEDELGT